MLFQVSYLSPPSLPLISLFKYHSNTIGCCVHFILGASSSLWVTSGWALKLLIHSRISHHSDAFGKFGLHYKGFQLEWRSNSKKFQEAQIQTHNYDALPLLSILILCMYFTILMHWWYLCRTVTQASIILSFFHLRLGLRLWNYLYCLVKMVSFAWYTSRNLSHSLKSFSCFTALDLQILPSLSWLYHTWLIWPLPVWLRTFWGCQMVNGILLEENMCHKQFLITFFALNSQFRVSTYWWVWNMAMLYSFSARLQIQMLPKWDIASYLNILAWLD